MAELFTAIERGDVPTVERLLDGDRALVEARDKNGLSPLLVALYRRQRDVTQAILRRRPTLTIFEAAAAGDLARVRELVDGDAAQANAGAPDGYFPLGLAAFFRSREVVRYLLGRGADVSAASRQGGFTALHSAVATDAAPRDLEIVRMLLDAGADPNARSASGGTPLHTAAFTGDRASLDLLLGHGADAAVRNAQGKTATEIANERGHQDLVRALAS